MVRSVISGLGKSGSLMALAMCLGASTLALDTERSIESGFAVALTSTDLAAAPATIAPVAGSEDYWLRQQTGAYGADAKDVERVLWRGPVAAGGTLVIGDGESRKELNVISVEPSLSEPSATRIDMGTAATVRVQARDGHNASEPDMWLELTQPNASTAPKTSGHAL